MIRGRGRGSRSTSRGSSVSSRRTRSSASDSSPRSRVKPPETVKKAPKSRYAIPITPIEGIVRTLNQDKNTPKSSSTPLATPNSSPISVRENISNVAPTNSNLLNLNDEMNQSKINTTANNQQGKFQIATPRASKSKYMSALAALENDLGPTYQTTPIISSAGTALISNLEKLPNIDETSNISDLTKFLDAITIHIEDYKNNLQASANWKTKVHSIYNDLMTGLNQARIFAADLNSDSLLTRCSELSSKLEESKLHWNTSFNTSSISQFHGFPSMISNDSVPQQKVANDSSSSHGIQDLCKKVCELESSLSGLNHLRTQFHQLGQRVAVIEETSSVTHSMESLSGRIDALSNRLNVYSSSLGTFDTARKIDGRANMERSNLLEGRISAVEELIESKCLSYDADQTKQIQIRLENLEKSDRSNLPQNDKSLACFRTLSKEFASFQKSVAMDMNSLRYDLQVTMKARVQTDIESAPPPATRVNKEGATGLTPAISQPPTNRTLDWVDSQVSSHRDPEFQNKETHRIESRDPPTATAHSNEVPKDLIDLTTPCRGNCTPSLSNQLPLSSIKCVPKSRNNPINSNQTDQYERDSIASSSAGIRVSSLSIQGKLLKTNMKNLKRLLTPEPSADIPKYALSDLYKNQLNTVETQIREISRALRDYLKSPNHDASLIESVSDTIEVASNWTAEIRDIYHRLGCHKKTQASKLYDSLPQFTKHSQIDVFEFFRRFTAYTEDFEIQEEKAALLYNKFLSQDIQEEIEEYKNDFKGMKCTLTHKYGDLKTITSDFLLPVTKSTKPNNPLDSQSNLEYYRRLNSSLQKINNLLNSEDVPSDEARGYIYSQDFLHLLLSFIPHDAKCKFIDQMQYQGEDTVRIRGKSAFKLIMKTVSQAYHLHDTSARTETPPSSVSKPRKAKQHQINLTSSNKNVSETDSDTERELTSSILFQKQRVDRPVSQLTFPCILQNHSHELQGCREFFFQSPKNRIEDRRSFKYRHCLLCLQSSDKCRSRRCSNIPKVPKELICIDCKEESKTNKRKSWINVLFCSSEKHVKPSNVEVLQALEKYLPNFDSTALKSPINLASHFQVLTSSLVEPKPKSLSRQPDINESIPVFNTHTGDKDIPSSVDLVPEVLEDSIQVMQYLSIKGKPVLTLYDRGANQHLIEGKLAENLGIKVLHQQPSAIGVVSGGKIWTEYGCYQMYLGPTSDGKYIELIAQGISAVTGEFPKYSLEEVNIEALASTDLHSDTSMPKYIGGERIGLLIGLKNPELEPVCIFTLPSGVGLYKSPFKDMFGSYYCYGGPHSVFSSVNKKFHGNVNHIQVFFTQMVNQYKNSLYPSLMESLKPDIIDSECAISYFKESDLKYSYTSSSGQTIHPSPLSSTDFEELGQQATDELESESLLCLEPHCSCPSVNIFKARIPLSRQRSYIDKPDIDNTINYRCEVCKKCKCTTSSRNKMISLSEMREQEAIEKSVTIDIKNKQVLVDLPFTVDPDDSLIAKHKGSDNYYQAHKVYKSVCRTSNDSVKDLIRKSHGDLVNKGFMKKLEDLPKAHQDLVKKAKFCHYMPWRSVISPKSTTTPCRLVVDPSMTGLNLLLAKGENKMRKITDILCRARTRRYIWSSDISKLYNRLNLKPSSYKYQLFLYHDSLDPDKEPEIYVMIVAWYGVTSSANQASIALEKLALLFRDKYPLAYLVLLFDTYVDDMISGANTIEERDEQIRQVMEVLAAGGFVVKYVIQSGCQSEEEFIKVLGYKWIIGSDMFYPGFTELNFNRKTRGTKVANPFPVASPDDVAKLLDNTKISRRMVVAKLAEIWDPSGYWEPYKLKLKLDSQTLHGLNWDTPLSSEEQVFWTCRFQEFLTIPELRVSRCIFPESANADSIRLLCISDAAEFAGGAAVYAGVQLDNGSYSCKLLASKSKLMSLSIPRNELEAIRLAAGLALDVKNAIGDRVSEVLYFTDSSIAMSWVHNSKKKLRLFCLNRVMEIRRLIIEAIGNQGSIPLYHIEGKCNPADFLTKPSNLKPLDLNEGSIWCSGYEWMSQSTENIPVTTFSDLQLSSSQDKLINSECYPEIYLPSSVNSLCMTNVNKHCSSCTKHQFSIERCYGHSVENSHCIECACSTPKLSLAITKQKGDKPMIDILHTGYKKSLRIISIVIHFTWILRHESHQSRGLAGSQDCHKCIAIVESNGLPKEYSKLLMKESLNYFLKLESKRLLEVLTKDQLSKFKLHNGLLYALGRVPEDAKVEQIDLDFDVFFDNTDLPSVLPVVSADSKFFYALLMHVHHHVRKHKGNEVTLREVCKVVFPISNPKRVIQSVRRNCPRCRLIMRKTLELEIGNHPQSRFQIVPAFYHCMCDIVYGFHARPFKDSRSKQNFKIYALVLVCLLTSATSILALEGLECQDVVMALERHSSRHGIPSTIFVDQGTQLVSLEKLNVTVRDASLNLKESLDIEIIPSTAKAHAERGRVERRIRALRDMLKSCAINIDQVMTPMQWETVFCKMASELDDIPLARGDRSSSYDLGWDILTPNRFKLGRSNNRAVEGPMKLQISSSPIHLLKRIQKIQSYWYQLLLDRMHHLIPKPDKWNKSDKVELEDIVTFRFKDNDSSKLEHWKIGKVVEILKGGRAVMIAYPGPVSGLDHELPKMKYVQRSPRDICIVSAASDLNLNSSEFFEKITRVTYAHIH